MNLGIYKLDHVTTIAKDHAEAISHIALCFQDGLYSKAKDMLSHRVTLVGHVDDVIATQNVPVDLWTADSSFKPRVRFRNNRFTLLSAELQE